jgi:hypothetical protein
MAIQFGILFLVSAGNHDAPWFAISPGAQNSKTPKTMRVRGLWSVVSAQLWRGADCFLQQRRSMV